MLKVPAHALAMSEVGPVPTGPHDRSCSGQILELPDGAISAPTDALRAQPRVISPPLIRSTRPSHWAGVNLRTAPARSRESLVSTNEDVAATSTHSPAPPLALLVRQARVEYRFGCTVMIECRRGRAAKGIPPFAWHEVSYLGDRAQVTTVSSRNARPVRLSLSQMQRRRPRRQVPGMATEMIMLRHILRHAPHELY